jgi:lysyl-tRNA synthetase class 2
MTTASTPPTPAPGSDDAGLHEAARRVKLQKLIDLGVDPWGGRFDDRSLISDIRSRKGEIRFAAESGKQIEVPDREANPDLDFRGWLQDQGKGEWNGPKVRAAGRIMLSRDAGKLRFINIQDWTGNLQLLVGKAQVGDESWAIAE